MNILNWLKSIFQSYFVFLLLLAYESLSMKCYTINSVILQKHTIQWAAVTVILYSVVLKGHNTQKKKIFRKSVHKTQQFYEKFTYQIFQRQNNDSNT